MAKLRQVGRCVLVGGLGLLGCGQTQRGDASAAGAAAGGTGVTVAEGGATAGGAGARSIAGREGAGDGAVVVAGGAGGTGGAPGRERTLCENEFVVVPGPLEDVELGFVGTFDGQPTDVRDPLEMGVPRFSLFRLRDHLEAIDLDFVITAAPDVVDAHFSVVTCGFAGGQLRRTGDGDGVVYFSVDGWMRSTTVTTDWLTGISRGTLHIELVNDSHSERHVLDGSFVWPASLGDAHI